MERFTFNKYYLEKNPTIVRFPLNNLDLKGCNAYEFTPKPIIFYSDFLFNFYPKTSMKVRVWSTISSQTFAMKARRKMEPTRFMSRINRTIPGMKFKISTSPKSSHSGSAFPKHTSKFMRESAIDHTFSTTTTTKININLDYFYMFLLLSLLANHKICQIN